jgi:hypothetical protein
MDEIPKAVGLTRRDAALRPDSRSSAVRDCRMPVRSMPHRRPSHAESSGRAYELSVHTQKLCLLDKADQARSRDPVITEICSPRLTGRFPLSSAR